MPSVSIRVPATSANLGCAFDCAALALGLYLRIKVKRRPDEGVNVHYEGTTPERVPRDRTNLIAQTISAALATWNEPAGFDLKIVNDIPVGVGLGSSAAARVAALAASYRLSGRAIGDEELVNSAARLEGHPDNVAAAWYGGFTIAAEQSGRVQAFSCRVSEAFECVVVVPDYAVPTGKAREVLPHEISRADAVHNLQRATILAAHLFSGQGGVERWLFDDRWHQPYRAQLIPGLSDVLNLTHPDLYGVCLSGAGPSILALARGNGRSVGEAIRELLERRGVKAETLVLPVDNLGARNWRE